MKAEEQRIAIAEWCGWGHGYIEENSFADPRKTIKHERWISPGGIPQRCCPDYLNDLNEIHEAEKRLDNSTGKDLIENLCKIRGGWENNTYFDLFVRSTAAQRCEALLRTLNLWKE